ncbi:MAG: Hint domain-containing protein [Alphaproteobacteria bacterium]|nr:Hint domain-containing protein [Alphaproteobacteria bacterium]
MSTESLVVPINSEHINGGDWVTGNVDDSQYVVLTDGGDLTNVHIQGFGQGVPIDPGQGPGGDDQFQTDLSGFNDDFSITAQSIDSGDTFIVTHAQSWTNDGSVYTIDYVGSDNEHHSVSVDVSSSNCDDDADIIITCFGEGMLIATDRGDVAVEALCLGDMVKCGDGESRAIRWMSKRHVGRSELALRPEFRPIRLRQDALGEGCPNADLVVSPQHRILIDDWRAELMFGEAEVLVAAVHLLNDTDITRDYGAREVTYYHFMFDHHQTIWSNGLLSESFYPGKTAIQGVIDHARTELFALFPELAADPSCYGQTCLPALKAHEAHAMFGRLNAPLF